MQPRARQLSQKNHLATPFTSSYIKRAQPSQAAILPAVAALLRRSSICCCGHPLSSSSIGSRFSSMTISRPTAAAMETSVLGKEINADKGGANGDANGNAEARRKDATDAAAAAAPPLPTTTTTATTTTTTPNTPAAPAEAASSRDVALTSSRKKKKVLPAPPTPDSPLLSVAPMMDWTDVHYRSLARLLSKKTWLYTEMVVDTTLIHNPDVGRFLEFPESQRPIVCQLGGSDPAKLAAAAAVAARYGYDEINLNCGCPSDRVAGAGCFGASLMREPSRVAEACRAMREAVRAVEARGEAGAAMREVGGWGGGGGKGGKESSGDGGGEGESSPPSDSSSSSYRPPREIDVTVKCRLGVDDLDSYERLCEFVRVVSTQGQVSHFVVHARKCHLQGLSPAQNRSVPPLRHGWVFALKRDFPHLRFSLNGGLESTAAARDALLHDFGSVEEAGRAEEEGGAGAGGAAPAAASAAAASAAGGDAGEKEKAAATAAEPSPPPSSSPPPPFLLEGAMIGRAAYHSPWSVLSGADVELWGAPENAARSRREVLELYADYCDSAIANADAAARRGRGRSGEKSSSGSETRRRPSGRTLAAPLLGLFHGEPGGKRWRYEIDQALKPPAGGRKKKNGHGKKKKKKQRTEHGGGEKEEEQEENEEEEEEEIEEDRGPSMREVIALASRAVPDFVLDAPPPSGERIDSLARAAATAAEVAAEAAARAAAKKRKGPLPAPVKPLMAMPPPPVAMATAGAGAAHAGADASAPAAAAATED